MDDEIAVRHVAPIESPLPLDKRRNPIRNVPLRHGRIGLEHSTCVRRGLEKIGDRARVVRPDTDRVPFVADERR
ncbi:hypothetical protein GCM10027436_55660 [Actinophytocola sediminis]